MPAADDDFTNFLEFGMPFSPQQQQQQRQSLPPRSVPGNPSVTAPGQFVRMDTDDPTAASLHLHTGNTSAHDVSSQEGPPSSGLSMPSYSATTAVMAPGFYAQAQQPSHFQDHQHLPQHQPQEPSQQPASSHYHIPNGQAIIPPTPNSIELHGNAARYPQRVDEYEQAYYTPLISPAMTPLETQLRLPEYTIPGEYFTPLTSPALEAQNANSNNGYPFSQGGSQISDMGFLQSPVDHTLPASSTPSSPGLLRTKHRRHPSTTNRFSARAKKQQSPSVRPQARKKSLLSINPDEVLNGLGQDDRARHLPNGGSGGGYQIGSNESSQDSVSPEPLSEPLMPPPAIPHARKSPAIAPQTSQSQGNNAPATPAMLMRIQRSQQQSQDSTGQFTGQAKLVPGSDSHDDIMTDVVLPETSISAGPRPKMTRIDTTIHSGVPTPAASTSATPALEPKSAPVAPSPRSVAMPSPSGPIAKKSETPKLGPSSRKRPSLSSAQPSPQIRPKISPNIQPLAPRGDGISSETSALYLASKSNYQHILDGTLLPGVSYPETLAENLSSKRTNHKLAEQGRRNRINNALKEIEGLIPMEYAKMKIAKEAAACNVKPSDKEKEKAGNQAISKANTVEMAIDYIKSLQHELTGTRLKLAVAESRLGEREGTESSKDASRSGSNEETTTNIGSTDVASPNAQTDGSSAAASS